MPNSGEPALDGLIREALDSLSDGFGIFDADHRLLYGNAASRRNHAQLYAAMDAGMDWAEATALSVATTLPHLSASQVAEVSTHIRTRLMAGEPVELTVDTGRIARTIYCPISNGGIAAISSDVTDLREKEKELRVAKRRAEAASDAKSVFLANVSHEIRTPLNGMLGMAQVLALSGLNPDQREHVDAILDAGKTLVALLNDVLDLSKIEAGKLEISPIDNDLSHLMVRLYKLWRPVAEEKNVELTLDLAASLPARLKFDPVRVRQCVTNLLSNAVKFTETGEVNMHVSVPRSGPNAGLVQVRVTDSGIGIDGDALARLFSPFTQADGSTTRRFGGTGLGLSIAQKLARMMGGDIAAKSAAGEGSAFTFTFAAEAATEAAPAREPDAGTRVVARPGGPLNVLVVDDVALNRKVARLFMEHQGWTVTEAAHGGEALERLAAATFDVVLLDIHMPVMDGPETLRRIRDSGAAWARVPVIALTANAMSGDRERYANLGMDGYVSKPIDQRDMFAEISRVRVQAQMQAA